MAMNETARLALPLLAAGQAQKEVAHNEALLLLDMLVHITAESADLSAPPASPAVGACWIVAAVGAADWAGKDGTIAGWTASGWRFAAPAQGWQVWVVDRGHVMRFNGTAWIDHDVREDGYYVAGNRVVSGRQAPIADPAGGATVDASARAAIGAILGAMRTHGLIAT